MKSELPITVIILCVVYLAHGVTGEGLGGEDCKEKGENYCQDNRVCVGVPNSVIEALQSFDVCDNSSTKCICLGSEACSSSSDCDTAERCVTGRPNGSSRVPDFSICYVCGENPNSLNVDGIEWEDADRNDCPGVCVSVDALADLSQHELVFPVHRRASVLCDGFENCATPGHMVLNNNEPMMMRTYCDHLPNGCKRRVKYVNSPRMKAGIRILSKSQHLQFLAFAAAYESRTEETLLRGLVRLGM